MNLKDVINELDNKVNLERFSPVEKLVYGFTALILTSVVISLLTLVIKK